MGLREDVIAWNLQTNCNPQTTRRKILIRSHVDTIESLNPQGKYLDLFESTSFDATDTADYLYLRIFPDADSDDEVFGESPGLRNTFSRSTAFTPSTTRRGIRCTVRDRRRIIIDLLRTLISISETSEFNLYQPIKVIDYITPEPGDDYTVRFGAIQIDKKPGLIRRGDNYFCTSDWEFLFRDTELRIH